MGKAHGNRTFAEKISKDSRLLEWQTCDDEAEWQAAQLGAPALPVHQPPTTLRPNWVGRYWSVGAVVLIILTLIAGWMWNVAQRGVAQIEADLRDRVELDLWTAAKADDKQIHKLAMAASGDSTRPLTSTVHLLALPGQTAIVQIVTQPSAPQPALRQTRFYRQTAQGWLRTEPDAALWGLPHRLESAHFIFHFRQQDEQVVNVVAPQMDEVYGKLQRTFDLPPDAGKLVVEVAVEHVTGAMLAPQWADEPLVVPSPAVYLAPVAMQDNDILAQSIALPLIEYMGNRASKVHAIPARWQPLLRGLRLWQLWNLELPLAQWRIDVMKWLFVDASIAIVEQRSMLPARYTELCAMHQLWMLSPKEVRIPLDCDAWGDFAWSPSRWATYAPRTQLNLLGMPRPDWERPFDRELNDPYYSSEPVVVASLIEYIVAAYGDKRVPLLLASLAKYNTWETLVPAVFSVSASDFEKGWQSYLTQRYEVTPTPPSH